MVTMSDFLAKHKDAARVGAALDIARRALRQATDIITEGRNSFAERERIMLEVSNEACRLNLQEDLQHAADAHVTESLFIDGVPYRRHQAGSATYHSLCGPLRISRPTYRDARERNGPTVVPLELQAGIIERATPAMAYRVALGYAQCTSRQLEKQLAASLRLPPSRSTLERIAKAVGSRAKAHQVELEPVVRRAENLPADAAAISIGLDRTTIPMEEDLPSMSALHRRRTRTKPYIRRRPAPVHVQYRMAYVGTVTIVDDNAEALAVYRYASSADEGPERVVASMMADVRHTLARCAKRKKPPLPVGIVQDGALELWQLLTGALAREKIVPHWHEAIDRFHLMEHIAGALAVLPRSEHERSRLLKSWRAALSRKNSAIDDIQDFLQGEETRYQKSCAAAKRTFSFGDCTILRDHIKYIANHKHRMRYATHHKLGLPTGSGATEGACKSLVTMRTKGSGQRWRSRGVNAVLTLRAYEMSNRLPAFFHQLAAKYRATSIQPDKWTRAA